MCDTNKDFPDEGADVRRIGSCVDRCRATLRRACVVVGVSMSCMGAFVAAEERSIRTPWMFATNGLYNDTEIL